MRRKIHLTSAAFLTTSALVGIVISACGGSDPQPAQAPSASAYPQGYPPQGGYPQQPGYPQQQPGYPQQQPGYPQQQPTAAPTAPAAGGTMAVPGPVATPCQNDAICGTHKCNTQYGKCAFPCQTAVDCAAGNNCIMGVCAPVPAQH